MMSFTAISRRHFLATSVPATAILLGHGRELPAAPSSSPNEKLNIGVIGVGGQGWSNLQAVRSENIFALCDVDEQHLARAKDQFPKAKTHVDWRRMLDDKSIDAVVVSAPDHTHAVAAVAAMKSGRHVYCEKPLAHSIYEARIMAETAAKHHVVTQMGNQGHASDRLRRVVELVRSGALGPIEEVITWSAKSDKRFSPGDRPAETSPVPDYIHWNLWLGPAPSRPYHPTAYHPFNWRGWWDFGEGNFGDMACHIMDTPFWALDLGLPETVEAEGPPVHPESAPPWLIVRFEFPARGSQPPVKLTWYDGTKAPPPHLLNEVELPGQGALFIGERGRLLFPHSSGETQLLAGGESVPISYPDPQLPRPDSHHAEWIGACKSGGGTHSDFNYASRLTETILWGVIAYRTGKRLQWDSNHRGTIEGHDADGYIRPEFRKGWTL